MPIAEAGGALMASMVGLACRGRTWEWEGLSIRPLPWLAGGLAASLAVVPLGAVWIGTSRIGHGYSPTTYVSAAMALVGISLLIGPSIAPALSWTVPLAVYLATVIVQVAWRDWGGRWWPIADPRADGDARWLVSLTLFVAGVLVQAATRGGTIASLRRHAIESA